VSNTHLLGRIVESAYKPLSVHLYKVGNKVGFFIVELDPPAFKAFDLIDENIEVCGFALGIAR
jgi:hypothetical protein